MRILVLSDAHGRLSYILDAIEAEPTAQYVYYLGDGIAQLEEAAQLHPEKTYITVTGNCDFSSKYPQRDIRELGGKRIFATHGYIEHVKDGLYDLRIDANDEHCTIVLYGHTHEPKSEYVAGLYLFNPGSIRDGNYGVIDIIGKDVMCINKHLC